MLTRVQCKTYIISKQPRQPTSMDSHHLWFLNFRIYIFKSPLTSNALSKFNAQHIHYFCIHVHYTNSVYMSITHIQYTCPLHKFSIHVHYTNSVYISITQIQYTCTLHKFSMHVHYTNSVYISITQIQYTSTLHKFSMNAHYTYSV
jgi:hypothetical protein